jgi:hypothetical protein
MLAIAEHAMTFIVRIVVAAAAWDGLNYKNGAL